MQAAAFHLSVHGGLGPWTRVLWRSFGQHVLLAGDQRGCGLVPGDSAKEMTFLLLSSAAAVQRHCLWLHSLRETPLRLSLRPLAGT